MRFLDSRLVRILPFLLKVKKISPFFFTVSTVIVDTIVYGFQQTCCVQLVRWDRCKPWTPWNCILLNFTEANAHERLERLDEAYGQQLRDRVRRRHAAARQHFASLTKGLAEALREKTAGSWSMSVGPSSIVGQQIN